MSALICTALDGKVRVRGVHIIAPVGGLSDITRITCAVGTAT